MLRDGNITAESLLALKSAGNEAAFTILEAPDSLDYETVLHDARYRDPDNYPPPWQFISTEAGLLYERENYKYRAHRYPRVAVPMLGLPFWMFYYTHRHADDVMDNKRDVREDKFDYTARLINAVATWRKI